MSFSSYTEPHISIYTHQTLHLYSCLNPEGVYWGICSYIIYLIIYSILFSKKLWK